MSEIKTARDFLSETSAYNNLNELQTLEVCEAMEAYLQSRKPSDEEIWGMVQEKYFRASVENKNERIGNDVNAMKQLRDKIFK